VTTQAIELASGDTVAGALAKLREASADRVLFVIPSGFNLSAVDLRVLRREAATTGTSVALLTSNAQLRRLAAEAGISSFRNRGWAERVRWRQARQDPSVRKPPIGAAQPVAPRGPGLFDKRSPSGFRPTSFRRSFVRERSSWWGTLGLAFVLLAVLGGLLLALSAVIPSR